MQRDEVVQFFSKSAVRVHLKIDGVFAIIETILDKNNYKLNERGRR